MNRMSNRAYFSILAGILFLLTLPSFLGSLRSSEGLSQTWAATRHWIESAECARVYGKLLVGCPGGELVPFADISRADDPGHALLLGVYSLATGKTIQPAHISILNTVINYIGIAALVTLLFSLSMRSASIFALIALPILANAFHAISPHPAQFGVTLLMTIFPISVLGFGLKGRKAWGWIVLGGISLFVGLILRQSLGMIGVMASFISIAASFMFRRTRSERGALALLAAGVLFVSFAPSLLLASRDALYGLPKAQLIESHGIWHNLYIGLGAVPNSLGISWSDAFAETLVKSIDPSIVYVSEAYYETLKSEYFLTILSHPIEVIRIYALKLILTAQLNALSPITPASQFYLWPILILGFFLRKRIKAHDTSRMQIDAAFSISLLFLLAFLAQGALIHQDIQYARPMGAVLILGLCCVLEYWGQGLASVDHGAAKAGKTPPSTTEPSQP